MNDGVLFGPAPEHIEGGTFRWNVPSSWEQGRGAWGGLVATAVARAGITASAQQGQPLRSLSLQIFGPVLAHAATITTTLLRKGSNTTGVRVEVLQDGECKAHGVVITGAARVPDLTLSADDTAPELPPIDAVPAPDLTGAPAFISHFDVRPVKGAPFRGVGSDVLGYIRPLDVTDDSRFDEASLLGMVDTYWPSTITQVDEVRPGATMTFESYLLVDPTTVSPMHPLIHHGTTVGVREGYAAEIRRIWTSDGRLAVVNLQLVAMIK